MVELKMRCLLVAALLVPAGAVAQPAYRVRDINTTRLTGFGPDPTRMIASGSRLFFGGTDEGSGREPWTSEGTAVGTRLLRDLGVGSSDPRSFVAAPGGLAYFIANDSGYGPEIWRSDGTPAGTVRATELPAFLTPERPVAVGPTIFFITSGPYPLGGELWKTDGTPAGTGVVRDLVPGSAGGNPHDLVAMGGLLFFAAVNPATGRDQLWKSDGTEAGTVPLAGSPFDPGELAVVGTTIFFTAADAIHGRELWKTDGTEAGTVLVRDLVPGPEDSQPRELTGAGGGTVFFVAGTSGSGRVLWRSDGTAGGTVEVADPNPGIDSDPHTLIAVGGRVFFAASNEATGSELWVSDGTAPGTHLVADLVPGFESGIEPLRGVAFSGDLFFSAQDAVAGWELWRSDGTAVGTRRVADLVPGPDSSFPVELTVSGGFLYFAALTPDGVRPLWRTDGTSGGTVIVGPASPGSFSANLEFLGAAGDSLALNARAGVHSPLWLSDGTEAGTGPVAPGCAPCVGGPGTARLGDRLLFPGSDDVHGSGLWQSDGTAVGTRLVIDTVAGGSDPSIHELSAVGDRVFMGEQPHGELPRLFVVAGEAPTASFVTSVYASDAVAFKNQSFFIDAGITLWKSDGTAPGTVPLTSVSTRRLMPTPSYLYFWKHGVAGTELWQTDGTPAGTRLVADICPGLCDSLPFGSDAGFATIGDVLYFVADDGTHGAELWRTDGSGPGTFLVADIVPGPGTAAPASLTELDGVLLFVANTAGEGIELWRSDGTPGGTVLVKDIEAGPVPSFAYSGLGLLHRAGGRVFFSGYTHELGFEPWTSDGTSAGTVLLHDVAPGPGSSSPYGFMPAGARAYFVAYEGTAGFELWATDLAPFASVEDASVVEGDGGPSPARFRVRVTGVLARSATVAYATSAGTAQAGSDYVSTAGVLTFAAGSPAPQTIIVPVNGDSAQESDEVFELHLSAPSALAVGDGDAHGQILDDDPPRVRVTDASVLEGDTTDIPLPFQVQLVTEDGTPSAFDTAVAFQTEDLSASAAHDYTEASGTVTFPGGSASGSIRTVEVLVQGDAVDEADEAFALRLTPLGAAATGDGRGLIVDDDGNGSGPVEGLAHGSRRASALATLPGPAPRADWFLFATQDLESYEVVADAVSGDVQPLQLELMGPSDASAIATSVPVGTGSARSLRFFADGPAKIRVRSGGCGTTCGADDVYRLRAYATSYTVPRFNARNGLGSAVIVQNRTEAAVTVEVRFRNDQGDPVGIDQRVLPPRGSEVFAAPDDESGSVFVSHDGGYGALAGKSVTADPATGASYDSPMEPRPR